MIKITLSSANLGSEATEADFDAWANYVEQNIEDSMGLGDGSVAVEKFPFGDPGEDTIEGTNFSESTQAIRTWLNITGWEAFCSQ